MSRKWVFLSQCSSLGDRFELKTWMYHSIHRKIVTRNLTGWHREVTLSGPTSVRGHV